MIKKMAHTQKYLKIIFLVVLLTKLFVLITDLARELFFTEEKMLFMGSLKQFLKSIIIVKRMTRKHLIRILLCLQKKKKKDFN